MQNSSEKDGILPMYQRLATFYPTPPPFSLLWSSVHEQLPPPCMPSHAQTLLHAYLRCERKSQGSLLAMCCLAVVVFLSSKSQVSACKASFRRVRPYMRAMPQLCPNFHARATRPVPYIEHRSPAPTPMILGVDATSHLVPPHSLVRGNRGRLAADKSPSGSSHSS